MLDEQDRELIQRLLNKDTSAVREFYDRYAPFLLNFIRRKIDTEHDVEEIAQDVLFAFLDGIRDFTGKCKLRTYLCSIASNKIVDFYRKRKLKKIVFSQMPAGLETLIAENVDPEVQFDQNALQEKIKEVFAQLTPHYAKILILKYVEDRSVDEIAESLSCSFKSAESILFRARKAFVKLYSQSSFPA